MSKTLREEMEPLDNEPAEKKQQHTSSEKVEYVSVSLSQLMEAEDRVSRERGNCHQVCVDASLTLQGNLENADESPYDTGLQFAIDFIIQHSRELLDERSSPQDMLDYIWYCMVYYAHNHEDTDRACLNDYAGVMAENIAFCKSQKKLSNLPWKLGQLKLDPCILEVENRHQQKYPELYCASDNEVVEEKVEPEKVWQTCSEELLSTRQGSDCFFGGSRETEIRFVHMTTPRGFWTKPLPRFFGRGSLRYGSMWIPLLEHQMCQECKSDACAELTGVRLCFRTCIGMNSANSHPQNVVIDWGISGYQFPLDESECEQKHVIYAHQSLCDAIAIGNNKAITHNFIDDFIGGAPGDAIAVNSHCFRHKTGDVKMSVSEKGDLAAFDQVTPILAFLQSLVEASLKWRVCRTSLDCFREKTSNEHITPFIKTDTKATSFRLSQDKNCKCVFSK